MRKVYWVIPSVIAIVLLVAAIHWFNYDRIAIYQMRWTTGDQAGFNTYGPNSDPDGNPKILILLPGDQPQCYLISYSKNLLAYLRKESKPKVPVTLQLHYSFGKIYSFTILRFGSYDLRDELSQMAHNGSGDCVAQLDRYAESPKPGERNE